LTAWKAQRSATKSVGSKTVGDVQFPEYEIGLDAKADKARSEEEAGRNRLNSGVKTSRGPPCMTWPFGQKFWDTYPFQENIENLFEEVPKDSPQDSDDFLGCVEQIAQCHHEQSLTV